jgi:very-short-patch-repair endonuclease
MEGTRDKNDILGQLNNDELEVEYLKAAPLKRREIGRRMYEQAEAEILDTARKSLFAWGVEPYVFDWAFNENEYALWRSIRQNKLVMYPEFPVKQYYLDFGNPYLKIALEADSKEFHDKAKDTRRDTELLGFGWKTFRVSYQENVAPFIQLGDIRKMISEGDQDSALKHLTFWLLETGDGVVDAIEFFYFMSDEEKRERMQIFPEYLELATSTLMKHRLVEFALPAVGEPL